MYSYYIGLIVNMPILFLFDYAGMSLYIVSTYIRVNKPTLLFYNYAGMSSYTVISVYTNVIETGKVANCTEIVLHLS